MAIIKRPYRMVERVECECKFCSKKFYLTKSKLKYPGNGSYCGKICRDEHRKTIRGKDHWLYRKIEFICDQCGGRTFKKPKDSKHRNHFCGMRCKAEYFTGRKTKPCSEDTKSKIRDAMLKSGHIPPRYSGEDCHFWKGGITPENEAQRKSLAYRQWRDEVYKRDNYQCVIGGASHGNRLHADHIKQFAYFPELRFDVSNGRTLCEDCHRKTETFGFNKMKLKK